MLSDHDLPIKRWATSTAGDFGHQQRMAPQQVIEQQIIGSHPDPTCNPAGNQAQESVRSPGYNHQRGRNPCGHRQSCQSCRVGPDGVPCRQAAHINCRQ